MIIATLSCLALVACGGDDGEGGGGSDLASRLPGDARAVSVIDLTEVKKRLGLPEDADPTNPPGDDGAELAQARLFGYDVRPGVAPTRALVANFFRPYRCPGS